MAGAVLTTMAASVVEVRVMTMSPEVEVVTLEAVAPGTWRQCRRRWLVQRGSNQSNTSETTLVMDMSI